MPIVITSKFITKMLSIVISVYAVTLFPFIILSEEVDEYTMNHELIHFEQQKELYLIGFYILYAYDFVKGMIKYKNKDTAYFMIRFEQEAYNHQNDLGYISDREKQAWKQYEV
jgi:hypothetical protein|tara:strand:+ start:102 stop:440 length:339 start_codon:yes stop_codon:yes gene_type:complete